MKKSTILLTALAALSLAACGGSTSTSSTASKADSSAAASEVATSVASEEAEASSEEAEASSEEAEASSEEEETSSEEESEAIYSIVGSFNNWAYDATKTEYLFTKMDEKIYDVDQYYLQIALSAGDTFKVTDGTNWYPSGMGNDYNVKANGTYGIYFAPEGAIDDWYEGYFNVVLEEEGDEAIELAIDLTITNFDATTMQNPQFVYSIDGGAESYLNNFVVDSEDATHFTSSLALAKAGTLTARIALWGSADPWPEYDLFAENGQKYSTELSASATLTITGEIAAAADAAVGTWTLA